MSNTITATYSGTPLAQLRGITLDAVASMEPLQEGGEPTPAQAAYGAVVIQYSDEMTDGPKCRALLRTVILKYHLPKPAA